MEFVDRALARRLEAAEEMPQVLYSRLYQELHPQIGAAEEEICGAHMAFAGLGSPIGRATGLGLAGPVTADDLDRVEAFYRAHHAPSQVDVCPLTDAHLLDLLKVRGYVMTELNNVLFRRLTGDAAPDSVGQVPDGFTLRPGCADEALAFAGIVNLSFFPDGNAPEGFDELLAPLFQFPGAMPFVVEHQGVSVACGAGLLVPEHKIVALFGAGTLPEFRRRGLQTAILQQRIYEAARAGMEYAVIVTQGGTTSQRNAERLGFRLAYSKATVMRTEGDGAAH